MVNLGAIEKVDLREVWPNEASDFTPWLCDNLDKLGAALGLDLELQSPEAPVGAFSLDVLAHDLGSNRPVIIENQLEATDHDHLGKLLTYAAGYDAYAVVWLTREFRDEHRQALDWLNQRTGDDTQFFGVVVEAWKIDESRPAPHFRPVAMPNEWQKRTATESAKNSFGNVSERGERYRAFFQSLMDTLREKHRFTNARKGQPQSWYSFSSGYSGVAYGASFSRDGKPLRTLTLPAETLLAETKSGISGCSIDWRNARNVSNHSFRKSWYGITLKTVRSATSWSNAMGKLSMTRRR